jgi:hypothetical protein
MKIFLLKGEKTIDKNGKNKVKEGLKSSEIEEDVTGKIQKLNLLFIIK